MKCFITSRRDLSKNIISFKEFFIDEKFGKVPVGWEVKRVADVSDDVLHVPEGMLAGQRRVLANYRDRVYCAHFCRSSDELLG